MNAIDTECVGESVAARVAEGAAWLDEHVPGWERRVDLASLDLSHNCRCVLGQVFEDLAIQTRKAGWDLDPWGPRNGYNYVTDLYPAPEESTQEWAARRGFNIPSPSSRWDYRAAPAQWRELDETWISLIKSRFESGNLSA